MPPSCYTPICYNPPLSFLEVLLVQRHEGAEDVGDLLFNVMYAYVVFTLCLHCCVFSLCWFCFEDVGDLEALADVGAHVAVERLDAVPLREAKGVKLVPRLALRLVLALAQPQRELPRQRLEDLSFMLLPVSFVACYVLVVYPSFAMLCVVLLSLIFGRRLEDAQAAPGLVPGALHAAVVERA